MLQLSTVNLYNVLRDFNTLTHIRIVLFDAEFRELLSCPPRQEGFCGLLRGTPEGDSACSISDRNGCLQCAKARRLTVYRCHAGLTEVVVPIFDHNTVLAYVMFGQLIPGENVAQVKAQLLARYPEFADSIEKLPVRSSQEVGAAATVLQAITSYMMTNQWVIPEKAEFIRQLDSYIDDRIGQTVTVEELCAAFRVGRTRLYEICVAYLGCGPAAYIRSRRISHAQQLLAHTDRPVTDIASAVGFCDYNHFSRIFRQVSGISAREYRRQQRSY